MIEVRDLVFTYHGAAQPAVRGISFDVADGEIFGFLGPSGAGKSTTQKILIRLLKQYEGEACIFGRDLRTWGDDYFERVGVSFELPRHYQKLTALENLRLFGSLYRGETEDPLALLAQVGLEADAHTRVSQFSKGMQMRLNLVRALLHRPALLFLDEPTSGLDPVNARKVKAVVRDLKQRGATIFLTTHDMQVADDLCDRVAFMVDGRIVHSDAPRALKLRHGEQQVQLEVRCNGALERHRFPLAGLGQNDVFLSMLRTHPVETLHTQEATLEDIFVQVTGRSLT